MANHSGANHSGADHSGKPGKLLIGAIADDFTGATDLANTLTKQGMRTVQLLGVPDDQTPQDIDAEAVVIALKSRTIPANDAVSQSLAALRWLKARGVHQIIFKYCSTFDSRYEGDHRGNIGPVADALHDALDAGMALVCPAFPATGRSIYKGHLFVGDKLLGESSMKDHPLTPMRHSDLVHLMAAQSSKKVGLVTLETVRKGADAIQDRLTDLEKAGHAYAVIDVIDDDDLLVIGRAIADHKLVTGGSGIALGLPGNFRTHGLIGENTPAVMPESRGRTLVLAGSCSAATRGQIERVREAWPCLKIDVEALAQGQNLVDSILAWFGELDGSMPALIYSSADPAEIAKLQERFGRDQVGGMVEGLFAEIARKLAPHVGRLIVAGGETSGAVVSALGIRAIRIGPEIAPGVPWTESLGEPRMALALKSGNFGGPDFFEDALSM